MRWWQSVTVGVVVALAPAGTALADPPGPTDFESSITSITAADDASVPSGFSLTVEGVDAFLLLTVAAGITADVPGYDGEPYLRIDADCSVWQNRLSWSTWYNEDRYGNVERPAFVDVDAIPDWEQIDDDCSVAWHDHRIHWMDATPPIGAEPGDVVINALIPLGIDDTAIDVRVISTLMTGPSLRSALSGLIVGVAGVATVLVFGGRRLAAASLMVALASLWAFVIGVVTFAATPPDTGPDPRWWVLPIAAGLVGIAGAWLERRGQWFWATGALLVAGLMLGVWVWDRRTGLWRALMPSPWPGAVDRVATAGIAVIAVAAVVGALVVLISPGTARSASAVPTR